MWGVYEQDNDIHIIPCDENGKIHSDHIIDCFYDCEPIVIEENGKLIFNHNIIN